MPDSLISPEIISLVEDRLYRLLLPKEPSGEPLYKAMAYSALNGGKRVRAGLTLLFYNALSVDYGCKKALDYAAAVEMIHSASLIHDDLPAMDNDDFRRGKPSNHKVFGEAGAILAGDGLIIKAFEVASTNPYCTPVQNVAAVKVLSGKTGAEGMTAGQMLDISGDKTDIDINALETLHILKTSCLISAACMLGCIAADAGDNRIKAAEEYGLYLGLAFQIKDDILDIEGEKSKLGKTPGKDITENKATYPSLAGIENSRKKCAELTAKAVKSLDALGGKPEITDRLKKLAYNLSERNY